MGQGGNFRISYKKDAKAGKTREDLGLLHFYGFLNSERCDLMLKKQRSREFRRTYGVPGIFLNDLPVR